MIVHGLRMRARKRFTRDHLSLDIQLAHRVRQMPLKLLNEDKRKQNLAKTQSLGEEAGIGSEFRVHRFGEPLTFAFGITYHEHLFWTLEVQRH